LLNSGKCPHCKEVVSSVRIEDIDINLGPGIDWQGVSYCCPSCDAVLSVQIDPVALKTDIINVLVEELRRDNKE
jgi:hypothetical protein